MERLAAAGFRILPAFEILTHYVVERGGFAALVDRRPDGAFGQAGAPALLVGGAFAVLVWRDTTPWFVAKGLSRPAAPAEVEAIRQFDTDLRKILGL